MLTLEENDFQSDFQISQCPQVTGYLGKVRVDALIDTGSQVTCLDQYFYERNKGNFQHENLPVSSIRVVTAVKKKSQPIKNQILADFNMGKYVVKMNFLIVKDLSQDCIIGYDFIRHNVTRINIEEGYLEIKTEKESREQIYFRTKDSPTKVKRSIGINVTQTYLVENRQKPITIETKLKDIREDQPQLPSKIIETLENILKENQKIFSDTPGKIKDYVYRLRLTDEEPVRAKPYPIPFHRREAVRKEIDKMMEEGIIQPSCSNYLNPIVVVQKSDGRVRICLDARKLNEKLKADYERSETIDDILKYCGGHSFYSTIDLTKSFHQVELHPDDRKYTAFIHEGRMYEYQRVPFGLKVSLASLSRGLKQVLGELNRYIRPYVDDLLIMSQDPEHHIKLISDLFNVLRKNNITVNLEKTKFFRKRVEYVGYILSQEGLHPQKEKIEAIKNFPTPRCIKDLQSLMGLTNYYQRFNSKYAEYLSELTPLLKKNQRWKWGNKEENAFQNLKKSFIEEVILKHPNFQKKFILQADASGYAIAAQLIQEDENGRPGVVSYASRVLRGPELSYTTTEKELLSIVWAMKKFITYLAGRNFEIQTDHHALTYIRQCKNTTNRLLRWSAFLQQFDFEIKHIKGKENKVADSLSRNIEGKTTSQIQYSHLQLNNIQIKIWKEPIDQINKLIKNFAKNYQEQDLGKDNLYWLQTNIGKYRKINRYKYHHNGEYIISQRNERLPRLLVPKSITEIFIKKAHEALAHIGMVKLINILNTDFHIPKIAEIIQEVLQKCVTCQISKHPNKTYHAEAQFIKVDEPLQLISGDFLGPLTQGAGGVRYIFVLIDNFSKVVSLNNLKAANTASAVRCVEKFCREYGTPKKILTDRGTQFTSPKWSEAMKKLGIKDIYCSIRHPQGNISERINRDLGNFYRILLQDNHKVWPKYTEVINNIMNHNYHTAIGAVPIEVHLGEKRITPWGKILNKILEKEGGKISETILRSLRGRVKKKLEESGKKTRDKFNQNHKIYEFEIGDKVLIRSLPVTHDPTQQSSKFMKLYQGPYTIIEKYGNTTYLLADMTGLPQGLAKEKFPQEKIRGKFHGSSMKPFIE